MEYLTIALPKGRLGEGILSKLNKDIMSDYLGDYSRQLVFVDEKNKIKYIWLKNSDVITYVENKVADIGISGKDMIMESDANVFELKRLDIGKCKLSIAGLKDKTSYRKNSVLKVASKYVNVSKKFFREINQPIRLIKLNGSVELAPLLGLSDVIVDIVETGNTLRANGLDVIEDLYDISACVISNKISYKFMKERIDSIVDFIGGESNV